MRTSAAEFVIFDGCFFQDISRAGWADLEVWCLSRGLQEEITPEVLLLGSLNECSRLHLAGTSNNIMSRIIMGSAWLLLSVNSPENFGFSETTACVGCFGDFTGALNSRPRVSQAQRARVVI